MYRAAEYTSSGGQLIGQNPTRRRWPDRALSVKMGRLHFEKATSMGAPQRKSRSPRAAQQPKSQPTGERLQKVLAAAGLGSRRDCEELIVQGRVEVDRQVVTELGTRVDWSSSEVRVDGEVLRRPRKRYFMLNKPAGVVTTNWDPEGRTRVIDLVRSDLRLFPVGRLDRTSEGLILLTNDGELANQLSHPRYGVPKTYLVAVAGCPQPEELESLRRGVHLAEGVARVESVKIKKRQRGSTLLEIVLREGRNREIRRLLARVGHKVLRLKRIAQGDLRMGNLAVGDSRQLTGSEVEQLRRACRPPRGGKAKRTGSRQRQSTAANSGERTGRGGGAKRRRAAQAGEPTWEASSGSVLDYDPPAAEAPKDEQKASRSPKRKKSGRNGKQGGRRGKRRS